MRENSQLFPDTSVYSSVIMNDILMTIRAQGGPLVNTKRHTYKKNNLHIVKVICLWLATTLPVLKTLKYKPCQLLYNYGTSSTEQK